MGLFGRKPRSLARRGEDAAARYLRRQGYCILDRNVRLGRYEIDIIARDGDTIAFVEVKARHSDDPVDPVDNVDEIKQRHIRRAAHLYIVRDNDPDRYYRFDIVTVVVADKGKPAITLYKDAFQDEA